MLQISTEYFSTSWKDAEKVATDALILSEKIGYKSGTALAHKTIGVINYYNGQPGLAVNAWDSALHYYREVGDKQGEANVLGNLGGVYTQSNLAKSLEYNLEALKIAEEIKDSFRITTLLINIGALYDRQENTIQLAVKSYEKAIDIARTNGYSDALGLATSNLGNYLLGLSQDDKIKKDKARSKQLIDSALYYFKIGEENLAGNANFSVSLNNIGTAYLYSGNFEASRAYHNEAYSEAAKSNNKLYMAYALLGLAKIADTTKNYTEALRHLHQGEKLGRDIEADDILIPAYQGLSMAYAKLGRYDSAYTYGEMLAEAKQMRYNRETDDKLRSLQTDFDLKKKDNEIDLLSAEKELQTLALERNRFVRNTLMAGLLAFAIFLFILYRDYRQKKKLNKILGSQKTEIENLLSNMLPAEVSQELRANGIYTSRYYENTSVMFTDYQSFTALTETMSPQAIIEELNYSFKRFDEIIEKYGLEKIKTIGDAYMCAAGIPTPFNDHHWRIVKAAKEILAFVENRNKERVANGEEPWQIRIGINSGPLVAGVIGTKKYAYDIWGSTVNIASRMESNGEPGQINISASVYDMVKDRYECSYRGKIYAKNVGEVDMYFLGEEKKVAS